MKLPQESNMDIDEVDLVIVGAGPAGLSAATMTSEYMDREPTLLDRLPRSRYG